MESVLLTEIILLIKKNETLVKILERCFNILKIRRFTIFFKNKPPLFRAVYFLITFEKK